MGGIVGLTIRLAKDREYRGSCHTNLLPEGLWAAPFYVDLDASRAHVAAYLETLLESRRRDPEIEALWGGWDKLAPVEYGLVLVDYVTSTIVSVQNFSPVEEITIIGDGDDVDPERMEKWAALERAGLLRPSTRPLPQNIPCRRTAIHLPFAHTILGAREACDAALQAWCEEHFGLSDTERAAWAAWHARWAEIRAAREGN